MLRFLEALTDRSMEATIMGCWHHRRKACFAHVLLFRSAD
ncbi:hypothetical protein ApDm4_1408 [Acetobacter pomorum]|nr:hypothetical protein ApDm4_1408 [Acetobacter pomorum]